MLEDGIEQRQHIHVAVVRVEACVAVHRARVDSREVELLIACTQLEHELEDLIEDFVGACTRAIDLVDDDDGHQIEAEGMLENETRLRHGALEGIDQQQDAVGHLEHALDLATEVGMARRVDDIDLHVLVADGDVLGENRDAALALLVVGVQDALLDLLVLAEDTGSLQKAIDECGLAVIDVRDDGDVADMFLKHVRYPVVSCISYSLAGYHA